MKDSETVFKNSGKSQKIVLGHIVGPFIFKTLGLYSENNGESLKVFYKREVGKIQHVRMTKLIEMCTIS